MKLPEDLQGGGVCGMIRSKFSKAALALGREGIKRQMWMQTSRGGPGEGHLRPDGPE